VPERQPGYQAIIALNPASRQRTGLLPDLAVQAAGTGVLPMTRTAAQAGNRQGRRPARRPPGRYEPPARVARGAVTMPGADRYPGRRAAATSCSITRQAGT
jgi:hypothetical protein